MEPKIGYDIFLPLVLSSQTLSYDVRDVRVDERREKEGLHFAQSFLHTSLFVSFLPVLYLLEL